MDTKSIPVRCLLTFHYLKRMTNGVALFLTGDPRVSFQEEPMSDGVRSTLIIREAQDKYFGSYNCSVANGYGVDAAEIVLKKQSTLHFLFFVQ